MKNNYARIFAIISRINKSGGNMTHMQAVKDFTNGRTESLKDLSFAEVQEMERSLQKLFPNKYEAKHDPLDSSRKAVIAQFRSIGRTAGDAIAWAEKYGVMGIKKRFNDYTGQELYLLTKNAEKVKSDFIRAVNNKI